MLMNLLEKKAVLMLFIYNSIRILTSISLQKTAFFFGVSYYNTLFKLSLTPLYYAYYQSRSQ